MYDKLENLRANSFLKGENDVSMGGLLDPNKNSPNKQQSKARNGLFKAPQAVVVAMVPGQACLTWERVNFASS